jgi:hypothetical protein
MIASEKSGNSINKVATFKKANVERFLWWQI